MPTIADYNTAYQKAYDARTTQEYTLHLDTLFKLMKKYLERCASSVSYIESDQEELIGEYHRRIVRYMPKFKHRRGTPMGYVRTIINSANKRYIEQRYAKDRKTCLHTTYHLDQIHNVSTYDPEQEERRQFIFDIFDEIVGECKTDQLLRGNGTLSFETKELLKQCLTK
jgi:hypothetical protein